jgi:hypothetical protein
MIAPQTATLLDRLTIVQTAAFKIYQFRSLNQHRVNFSSIEPYDVHAAEAKLERINRIVEAARKRQAKRDGWVYPPKMH